jgi:nucleoid DNA-binding protein
MKKSELARKVARKHSIEPGAAADHMDRVVNQIIRALRRGEEARLPGLGRLIPGKDWAFEQESDER